jgi:hypothetical protein
MKGFYRSLKDVVLPSCYKVAVITRACAVLESRRKSETRGRRVKQPKALRQMVCITSGFFITMKGRLFVQLRKRNEYADVLLNTHVQQRLEGKKLRSLTITPDSLSLCYSEEVESNTVIPLTRAETYGSSSKCASCGERLHNLAEGDAEHRRMLWCQRCRVWVNRDVNAAIVLSQRGRLRFDRSLSQRAGRQQHNLLAGEKGLAVEAVKGNEQTTVPILGVDASKLGLR